MAEVEIDILARLDGIDKNVAEFSKLGKVASDALNRIEKDTKEVNKSTSLLGSGVSTAAIAFTAFNQGIELAKKLAHALAEPIAAAAKQEEATNDLNTALALTGQFSEEASRSLQEFAAEIQRTTKFEDDAVLSAQALLQNLARLDEDGLKRATQASIDLAAALKIDLNSAATLVGKAAEGNITAFGKLGIQIQKGKTDAETFANTLEILNSRFGGAAQAQVNTFSGAVARLGHSFGDVLEEIGNAIVQNTTVIAVINAGAIAFQALAEIIKNDVVPAIGPIFADAISASVTVVRKLIQVMDILERAASVAVLPIKVMITVLAGLAGSIDAFKRGDFSAVFQIKDDVIGSIKKTFETVKNGGVIANSVKGSFDKLGDSIQNAAGQKFGESTNAQLQLMSDRAKKAGKAIDEDLLKSLEELEKKFKNAGLSQIDVIREAGKEAIKNAEEIAAKEPQLRARALASIEKITIDTEKKIQAEKDKLQKQQRDEELKEIARQKERTSALISGDVQKIITEIQINAELSSTDFANIGASFIGAIADGAKGAEKAVVGAIAAAGEALLPGFGQAIGKLAEFLAKGPDDVRKAIQEFFVAIPQVILKIVSSIPVFVQTLIQQVPLFIQALIAAVPQIILAVLEGIPGIIEAVILAVPDIILALLNGVPLIIEGLASRIPLVVQTLIDGIPSFVAALSERIPLVVTQLALQMPIVIAALVQHIPQVAIALQSLMPLVSIALTTELIKNAPSIAQATIKAFITEVPKLAQAVGTGIRDAVQSLLSSIKIGGKSLGFAKGGEVPSGFPNDSFVGRLTSGETVVDRSTTADLKDFLRQDSGGGDSSAIVAALGRLEAAMSKQQNVIQIGGRVITQVLREELESGRVVGL